MISTAQKALDLKQAVTPQGSDTDAAPVDELVRLLVCAIVIDDGNGDTTIQSLEDSRPDISERVIYYRFVLPIQKSSKILDLCQKIEGQLQIKLQAKIKCTVVYVSAQSKSDSQIEAECQSVPEVNKFFERQYQVDSGQTVSLCFRDFDKIMVRLTKVNHKLCQNYKVTPLITQWPANADLDSKMNKREKKQEAKELQKTAPSTPVKLSKNARKKLRRKQEKEEQEMQARKMSEFRDLLRLSINGYSQEEASKCISNSRQSEFLSDEQKSTSDVLNESDRKSFQDIERVLRLNSESSIGSSIVSSQLEIK